MLDHKRRAGQSFHMKCINALKLLLPALIPSWNFFDLISPSPRIQFSLLKKENDSDRSWQEFRPRPKHSSFLQMIKRVFWNPAWNESLYLVSCAERIIAAYTPHSEDEILSRIESSLKCEIDTLTTTHLQFQIIVVQRNEKQLQESVVFTSHIQKLLIEDAR